MKIGDVVRLKSGGPLMTVVECRERGSTLDGVYRTVCSWIRDGGHSDRASFPPECLDLVPNFSATSSAPMPADKPCRCGHDLYIEHSNVGCLQGCAHDLCAPEDGQHGL